MNCFVSRHEHLAYGNLGAGFVVSWCKLYFTNHQAASIPRTSKDICDICSFTV